MAGTADDFAISGAESFRDVWARRIYPVIRLDYEELMSTTPSRIKARQGRTLEKKGKKEKKEKQEKKSDEEVFWDGVGTETDEEASRRKIVSVLEEVREKSERRNAYMNLAWTGPIDNTSLQVNIPYEKVANMAVDMFCDTSHAASAQDAEASSTAASTEGEGTEKLGLPKPSLLQAMERQGARPWNIPAVVERGFEIPICITDTYAVPELGKFKRLGMDVVVNAVWLALYWAKKERNDEAVSALRHLILDWPMDFVLIQGTTPEELDENMFKWTVNMSAKVERLRDFIGLENNNLMRIVMVAADIVKSKLVSGKKANAEFVHKWLVDNVRWGAFNCPDVSTVERHMSNWGAIQKNGRALALIEAAVQRWGRNNLLDWPTKLAIIVSKTDATSLCYVVEALYAQMWRKNVPDPYGVAELKRIIPEILWARSYVGACARQYSEVFKSPTDPADKQGAFTMSVVRRFLESPLAFFMKTESPERDPTWLQSLPNEALRCFMKHLLDVSQGLYQPEIKGALSGTSADKYSVEKFHKGTRVNQRFTKAFLVAHDSILGLSSSASACAAAGQGGHTDDSAAAKAAESAGSQKQESQAEKKPQDSKETDLQAFRSQCEKHCLRELEARLVSIVAEGSHVEINASVTSTRLYQNLTDAVPCMAFYDVKNAKLCNIFEGEGYIIFTVFPTSCSKPYFPRSGVSNAPF
jgi:hypothetical protein